MEIHRNQFRAREQAAFARSPRERRAEIKGILKSLGRRGTINGGGR